MCPIFEYIEEIIPENIFSKLDELHNAMDIIHYPERCIYCGSEIRHKWTYSSEKWCEFEIYCINLDCNWIVATIGFDANCPELL